MASTECQSPEGGGGRSRTNRGAGLKFHMPPRDVIERLAESSAGDIRSATNALQFACLKGVMNPNYLGHTTACLFWKYTV